MKLKNVVSHFGSKKMACEALGITKQAGSRWGYWMHRETAQAIEAITQSRVTFDYSASDIVIDNVKYEAATDIDRAYRVEKHFDKLYFLVDKKMVKPTLKCEALKLFRKCPPFRISYRDASQ